MSGSAQTMVDSGQRCLIAREAMIPVRTNWRLNQPRSFGPTRGKYPSSIAQDRKLISFSGQTTGGRPLTDWCNSSAATAKSVKGHETRPDGRAIAVDTGYQSNFR